MRKYSDAQEIGRVAVSRHPVFQVENFTQHARKGQPNAHHLTTVSPDQRALPRGEHVAQLRTRISCGRRSEQQKEGIEAQERRKADKRFNEIPFMAGESTRTDEKRVTPTAESEHQRVERLPVHLCGIYFCDDAV